MCPECEEHFGRQWDGLSQAEYLERFDFPVLLVEGDVRVVAANRAAGAFLGREPASAIGLLGGEAMECAHARLPEGCGRTVHCSTCAIRNSVTRTHRTGESLVRVPARLRRSDRDVDLVLTTTREGGLVRVLVEPAP
jgi:PAS domain-containing protein